MNSRDDLRKSGISSNESDADSLDTPLGLVLPRERGAKSLGELSIDEGIDFVLKSFAASDASPFILGVYGHCNAGKTFFLETLQKTVGDQGLPDLFGRLDSAPSEQDFQYLPSRPDGRRFMMAYHYAGSPVGGTISRNALLQQAGVLDSVAVEFRFRLELWAGHGDPAALSIMHRQQELDLIIGIYNPNIVPTYAEVVQRDIGDYDLVIKNPLSRKKRG